MEKKPDDTMTFDMGALKANLPKEKGGLSRYYSGKSRKFWCFSNVRCLDDLKKEDPEAKRKKKQQSD